MKYNHLPQKQGLYDPRFEHDSCGVGFVCDVKGRKSNQIIRQSLEVLRRLSHRGATGADPRTGDGAGLLIQIPHDFFLKVCRENKIDLPAEGEYGVGLVFLPRDEKERKFCKNVFARIIRDEKQILLGWRSVPVDGSNIGKIAQDTQPAMEHVFIGQGEYMSAKNHGGSAQDKLEIDGLNFERKLYCLRKKIENAVRLSDLKEKSVFYIPQFNKEVQRLG